MDHFKGCRPLLDGARTPDMGGKASTQDIGKAIADALRPPEIVTQRSSQAEQVDQDGNEPGVEFIG